MLNGLRTTYEKRLIHGFWIVVVVAFLETLLLSPQPHRIWLAVFSLLGLPIGFAMCFAVLWIQKVNPFCPKGVLRFFCGFFFIFSLLGMLVGIVFFPLWAASAPGNVMVTSCVGSAWAAHVVWKRHGNQGAATMDPSRKAGAV